MRAANQPFPSLAGPWRSVSGSPLIGEVLAPGDKSISHRALIFAGLADGESTIRGLLEGDDVLRTATVLRALGVEVERDVSNGTANWRVHGGVWRTPDQALYFGNSGTGCRLMMGAIAGREIAARFDGDASLRARPMGRILDPLIMMGANAASEENKLPAHFSGGALNGIEYTLPVASAQIKSAVLLASLGATGTTSIIEPTPSRDHSERMLAAFGAPLSIEENPNGGRKIISQGGQNLTPANIDVPGDPSSAAFPVIAALITPGAHIVVRNVLMNPLRSGVFTTLKEMGADLSIENERMANGEPIADICARHSPLKGVAVPASRAPAMIDEYPILAVAAAFASGDTYMPGIEELRVKETDRIDATTALLQAAGVETDAGPDWLRVVGCSGNVRGGAPDAAPVKTRHDHRIAMSALVLGLGTDNPMTIDDASMIATSFPNFFTQMASLGAQLTPVS